MILIIISLCAGLALGYGIWGKEKVKADRLQKALVEKEVSHSRTLAESDELRAVSDELRAKISGLETDNDDFKDILKKIDELIGGKVERVAAPAAPVVEVTPSEAAPEAKAMPVAEPPTEEAAAPVEAVVPAPEAAPVIHVAPVEVTPSVVPAPPVDIAPELTPMPDLTVPAVPMLELTPLADPMPDAEVVPDVVPAPDVEAELKAHDDTVKPATPLKPVPELKSLPAAEADGAKAL